MDVAVEIRKDACLLVLSGEIDRSNLQPLAAALSDCIDSNLAAVVLDLGEVTFLDGGALGLLHDALDKLGDDRWLGAARPLPEIRRVLQWAPIHSAAVETPTARAKCMSLARKARNSLGIRQDTCKLPYSE